MADTTKVGKEFQRDAEYVITKGKTKLYYVPLRIMKITMGEGKVRKISHVIDKFRKRTKTQILSARV